MNLFRLVGDLSHLFAILMLLLKIWKTRSCAGLSGKTQILFALVFSTRYLDLLTTFISVYNSVMKVLFLAGTYGTLYLIYVKYKATYNRVQDTFRIEFLVLPALVLALQINYAFETFEILWTFSIYLEAVAILPQLFLIVKTGEAESITLWYLLALGSYRALYILNWVYRYYAQNHYDVISIVAGTVQTILYCNFFYVYITKGIKIKIVAVYTIQVLEKLKQSKLSGFQNIKPVINVNSADVKISMPDTRLQLSEETKVVPNDNVTIPPV